MGPFNGQTMQVWSSVYGCAEGGCRTYFEVRLKREKCSYALISAWNSFLSLYFFKYTNMSMRLSVILVLLLLAFANLSLASENVGGDSDQALQDDIVSEILGGVKESVVGDIVMENIDTVVEDIKEETVQEVANEEQNVVVEEEKEEVPIIQTETKSTEHENITVETTQSMVKINTNFQHFYLS